MWIEPENVKMIAAKIRKAFADERRKRAGKRQTAASSDTAPKPITSGDDYEADTESLNKAFDQVSVHETVTFSRVMVLLAV